MTGDHDRRIFIAIPMDGEVREIARVFLNDAAQRFPEVSWCDFRGLHLTLHFFGYVDPDRRAVIHDILDETSRSASKLKLALSQVGFFPDAEHPRVVWAGVTGQTAALAHLQSCLMEKLKAAGFEIDPRPFTPHVTLGRVKKKPLALDLTKLRFPSCPEHLFSEAALYESRPTPQGSRYEILETFSLRQAPQI